MKAVWIGAALLTAALHAQTFEVATVKRTAPGTRAFRLSAEHGTLTGRNVRRPGSEYAAEPSSPNAST